MDRRDITNSYIYYKRDSLSEATKVQGHMLKAFTMASDSFVVLRKFKVFGVKQIIDVPIGFCKVIVGDGKVILYSNTSNEYVDTGAGLVLGRGTGTPSSNTAYLVQQRGSTTVMAVEEGIDEFIAQMSQYMKISDMIVAKLKNREYSYFKTEQLVRDFNAWFRERKSSM